MRLPALARAVTAAVNRDGSAPRVPLRIPELIETRARQMLIALAAGSVRTEKRRAGT